MKCHKEKILKTVTNEFSIRNLFKLMFYRGECLYLSFNEIENKKLMGFIVDYSRDNFTIKLPDNFVSSKGQDITLTSNYKNIQFLSTVRKLNDGYLQLDFPNEVFVRNMRSENRKGLLINKDSIKAEKLSFYKSNCNPRNFRLYDRKILDLSHRGIAIEISVLEPDTFEVGDVLTLELDERLKHLVGFLDRAVVKHLNYMGNNDDPEFCRVWLEFVRPKSNFIAS